VVTRMTRRSVGPENRPVMMCWRPTGWRRGVRTLVAVLLALSVMIVPPIGHSAAEETPATGPETTVPETTGTETTVPETTVPETTTPETTVPETTGTESTVLADTTSPTVSETSGATPTTIDSQPSDPEVAPADRSAARATASALGSYRLSFTDPWAVSPAALNLGSYFVGSVVNETVTLVNDTGGEVYFEVYGVAVLSVTSTGVCGSFLPPGNLIMSVYLATDETCDITVGIDATVAASIAGQLVVTDDSGSIALVDVTAEVVPVGPPANDNWVNAQDLSASAIPPFVAEPGQFPGTVQPRDTLKIDGTTENATYETGEYDPGRPGGSVWYRYTSPPGGFAGRLGYRATPGVFVQPSTANTSATDSASAQGNTWPPSGIQFVRMAPGHTVWFRVYNESVDPGRFTLELFQAPNEQNSIAEAYQGGESALSADFNLFGDGDTHHLTPDLPGGAPSGWFTLRFAVPGSLSVTYRSATARTVGQFGEMEGSDRPLGLRIYRSPQPTLLNDPTVLGAPIAVAAGAITATPAPAMGGPRWEATATVPVTPGRYYWTFEEGPDGPTFFQMQWQFRADRAVDTEPPTATITTPPGGARYAVGSVPSSVVSSCTDNQGATTSFITVDGIQTTSLATTVGSHTVSLECTDASGNMSSTTSTYTVTAPSGPCVIVDTQSVDFGEVAVGTSSGIRPVVVRSCSDTPVRLALSVSNATHSGDARTWLASTATVPADNQFTWSVTPPSGPTPIPVGSTQTSVGPVLASGASRTDSHRIALGPTGPGLGSRFTSTFIYTAVAP